MKALEFIHPRQKTAVFNPRIFLRISIFLCTACFFAGCGPSIPPIKTLSEAQQKLIKTCQEEYNLRIVVTVLPNTLYVYLPLEDPLLVFKSNDKLPGKDKKTKDVQVVKYVDAQFDAKEKNFLVDYDIESTYTYPTDYGYQTPYGEEFTRKRNNLFTAIYRAYTDLDMPENGAQRAKPGDVPEASLPQSKFMTKYSAEVDKDQANRPPAFIIVIVADIKTGIESETIVYFEDFKQAMNNALPFDEYAKRYVTNLRGWQEIIGDKEGKHLEYQEMTWPEFIAKQMANRVKFKYQQSSFPPSEDSKKEILDICREALSTYRFKDFNNLLVEDLHLEEKITVGSKDIVKNYPPEHPSPGALDPSSTSNRYKVIGIDLMEKE